MDAEHKAKLVEGRADARVVKAYLQYLDENKPKRGRRRTVDSISNRLAQIDAELPNETALSRLKMFQERTDLTNELEALGRVADGSELREEFVGCASRYAAAHGLKAGAFRQMGVDTATVKEAKIL